MPKLPKFTVLLVEDDDVDAMAVRRMFKKQDIPVRIERARDGEEGLVMLRTLVDEGVSNLLVLLDINMPAVNGHEFLASVRSDDLLASTVVFILTTSVDPNDVTAAYSKQVAGYFQKAVSSSPDLEIGELLGSFAERVIFPLPKRKPVPHRASAPTKALRSAAGPKPLDGTGL